MAYSSPRIMGEKLDPPLLKEVGGLKISLLTGRIGLL